MSKSVVRLDKRKLTEIRIRVGNGELADQWGEEIANEVKEDVRSNWSGRYPPASRAGEPPAIRTGTLDLSITVEPKRRQNLKTWIVSAKAFYADFLEYGTSRMEARPFLRPAAERARQRWRLLAAQTFNRLFNDRRL